jgi:hypothetical protein
MQGDIKQDQKELFKKMKAALKSDFIVAFNKVDARDPGSYVRWCTIEEYSSNKDPKLPRNWLVMKTLFIVSVFSLTRIQ